MANPHNSFLNLFSSNALLSACLPGSGKRRSLGTALFLSSFFNFSGALLNPFCLQSKSNSDTKQDTKQYSAVKTARH